MHFGENAQSWLKIRSAKIKQPPNLSVQILLNIFVTHIQKTANIQFALLSTGAIVIAPVDSEVVNIIAKTLIARRKQVNLTGKPDSHLTVPTIHDACLGHMANTAPT